MILELNSANNEKLSKNILNCMILNWILSDFFSEFTEQGTNSAKSTSSSKNLINASKIITKTPSESRLKLFGYNSMGYLYLHCVLFGVYKWLLLILEFWLIS